MKLLRYGDTAVLAEPDVSGPAPLAERVLALAAAARGIDGVLEVVPAARTVLVVAASEGELRAVEATLRELAADAPPSDAPPSHAVPSHAVPATGELTLDVRYDGADLAATAAEIGLDPDGVVRLHCGAEYVVAFCGFVPGFGYLTGLPDRLHLPRLPEPRTRVPAGSVGIAGEFTGVYPRQSPGGWRLLGRTDEVLWNIGRTPPALLVPGTRVRFRPA